MTIKQQGGIFGRNPTFNDVDVEGTLTTSGSFTAASFDATGDATVGDQLAVGTTDQNGQLHVYSGDSGASLNSTCNVFIENNGSAGISIGTPSANSGFIMFADEGGTGRGFIQYDHATDYLNLAAAGSTRVSIQGNNIALNNGGGIDFSATSGTGTSELFSDYEEGTFSPILTDLTNNAGGYNIQNGYYTKIGREVQVRIYLRTTSLGSVSGAIYISGLPFTSSSSTNSRSSLVAGFASGLAVVAGQSVVALIAENASVIGLQVFNSTLGTAAMQATEWTADGRIALTGSYIV